MPFASLELFTTCREMLLADPNLDAVIPSTENGLEPLHAIYRRETCLPAVREAIEAGKWKLIAWHSAVNLRVLTPEETARFNPQGLVFWNLNTPEEFESAIKQINKSENR